MELYEFSGCAKNLHFEKQIKEEKSEQKKESISEESYWGYLLLNFKAEDNSNYSHISNRYAKKQMNNVMQSQQDQVSESPSQSSSSSSSSQSVQNYQNPAYQFLLKRLARHKGDGLPIPNSTKMNLIPQCQYKQLKFIRNIFIPKVMKQQNQYQIFTYQDDPAKQQNQVALFEKFEKVKVAQYQKQLLQQEENWESEEMMQPEIDREYCGVCVCKINEYYQHIADPSHKSKYCLSRANKYIHELAIKYQGATNTETFGEPKEEELQEFQEGKIRKIKSNSYDRSARNQ